MTIDDGDTRFRFFDPLADFGVHERHLPHWMQAKTLCFITWRTLDSMPADVVKKWHDERVAWLAHNKIGLHVSNVQSRIQELPLEKRREYYRLFSARWNAYLDNCYGSCPLRQPELAKIVADALRYFDNERYLLTDFVVMPNHVHLLAAFFDAEQMLKQCESWKHYTATQINKKLGRKGRFWETDSFDHLVRSEAQWIMLREYIRGNPSAARLHENEYISYSREII